MAWLTPLIVEVARLTLWLVLLTLLFVPLERRFAVRPAEWRRPAWGTDLAHYFVNSLALATLLAAPLAMLLVLTQKLMPQALPEAVAAWPRWMQLILALVVAEFGFYWGHRMAHRVPLLWRMHAVHHSAPQLDFMVNTRAHPLDMLVIRLCCLAPLVLLGLVGPGVAGSAAPLALLLVATVWGFFLHANLRWRLGPLEWLITTPAFHHWHHTLSGPVDKNFAALLPVMDRLFGTWHLPAHWPHDYGIHEPMPTSLPGQWLVVLRGWAAPAAASAATTAPRPADAGRPTPPDRPSRHPSPGHQA